MNKVKTEKTSFVVYKDRAEFAAKFLDDTELGECWRNITAYLSGQKPTIKEKHILMCFSNIVDGIEKENKNYEKEVARRLSYYQNKKNTNNSNNTNNFNNSVTDTETDTETVTDTDTDTETVTDTEENKNINNNSLSIINKYTKKQVKEILERERIFFKNLSFENFWKYNRENGWKYDPITAAGFYIERHPDCLSIPKKEDPTPAAPAPAQGNATKGVLKEVQDALNIWNKLKFETVVSGLIPGADGALLNDVTPLKLTAEATGKKIKRVIAGREIETNEIKNFLYLRVTDKIIEKTLSENAVFRGFFEKENIILKWIN